MEGNRRQYSEEFKKDAVGHSLTSEKTVIEVAQDLGIAHSNLRRWRTQYGKNGDLAVDSFRFIREHTYSRKIIGWSMKNRITPDLVIEALNIAIKQRKPSLAFTLTFRPGQPIYQLLLPGIAGQKRYPMFYESQRELFPIMQ